MFKTLLATAQERIWTEYETFDLALQALNTAIAQTNGVKEAYIYRRRNPEISNSGIMIASLKVIK